MEIGKADRVLVRAGFVLFLLALLTGLAIPAFLNEKMALAAHVTGVLNALMLIVLGLARGLLVVGPALAQLTTGLVLYGTYTNWGTSCLAAAWGTSRFTPISGAGFSGTPWQEAVVQALQVSLALAMLTGAALVVYALRPSASRA